MRRRVARTALLRKSSAAKVQQRSSQVGRQSLYQEMKRRGGQGAFCVIRRVGGIGDVLMLTPVLRHLKREFPNCKLTFAIDMHTTGNNVYYELVKNAPFVDEIIDARYVDRNKYDAVMDASSVCLRYERSGLPPLNRIDLFARAAGITFLKQRLPFFELETQEKIPVDGMFYVLLHTASNEDKRCWPVEKYKELIGLLDDLDIVFLVADFNGKSRDWSSLPKVRDISNCGIRSLASWIERANVFVGPDSGPMHLAGALKTKSVVLFGSIPPDARINHYSTHTAITSNAACAPCWYRKCPYEVKCMKDIQASAVAQQIRKEYETNCTA